MYVGLAEVDLPKAIVRKRVRWGSLFNPIPREYGKRLGRVTRLTQFQI